MFSVSVLRRHGDRDRKQGGEQQVTDYTGVFYF
jgi:hypothetical protein